MIKKLLLLFALCFIVWHGYTYQPVMKPKRPSVTTVYEQVIPNLKQADSFLAECTAYTAGYESTGKTPGDKGYGITSSGKQVRPGYVAADIRVLPYGTLIYIDGLGVFEVQDTGNSIKGCRIDIYYENLTDALNFGRQMRNIIILHKG